MSRTGFRAFPDSLSKFAECSLPKCEGYNTQTTSEEVSSRSARSSVYRRAARSPAILLGAVGLASSIVVSSSTRCIEKDMYAYNESICSLESAASLQCSSSSLIEPEPMPQLEPLNVVLSLL